MPAAVPAIAAAAGSLAAGTTLFGLTPVATALLVGASSFAMSSLQSALTPKPKTPDFSAFSAKAQGQVVTNRDPVAKRKGMYGEARTGASYTWWSSSGTDNKYFHLVLSYIDHEMSSIDEIWFDDVSIPLDALDASGNVISGKFSGKARIKIHLGIDSPVADADLVAEVTDWTSTDRGRGVAYLYVRLQYDRNLYNGNVPNITIWGKGKSLWDPRTSSSRWSPNPALMVYDYLTTAKDEFVPGVGAASSSIDDTACIAAANICEEIVATANLDTEVAEVDTSGDMLQFAGPRLPYQTGDRVEITTTGTAPTGLAVSTNYYVIVYQRLGNDETGPRIKLATSLDNAIDGVAIDITGAGTGTHTVRKTGEPRYFGGGLVESSDAPEVTLAALLSAMGGDIVKIGGKWIMNAAAYSSPSVTLDEAHLTATPVVRTRMGRRERFNTVKGVYASPINDNQPQDYPAVTNSTYVTNDNGETLVADLDLPFTPRPHTAQRLAKIKLERARQEIIREDVWNLHAMQIQPTDTVYTDFSVLGWSGKIFDVQRWQLTVTGGDSEDNPPTLAIKTTMQETASAVYDWNSGEETSVDPAPNTTFPDAFTVGGVVGMTVNSEKVNTANEDDSVFNVLLSWQQHSNEFVYEGGHFDIQFKKSSESEWQNVIGYIDGSQTSARVFTGQLGTTYDIRIRAVNNLGRTGNWSTLTGFVVGTAGGVTATQDWGNWTDTVTATQDWGNWTDTVTGTQDWGGFS